MPERVKTCRLGLLASNSRGMMSAGGDAMQRLYDSNMQLVGYLSSDAAGRMKSDRSHVVL